MSGLLLLGLLMMVFLPVSAEQKDTDKVDPQVLEEIGTAGSTDFFLWLRDQADVSGARQFTTKAEKGQYVFETLKAQAEVTQASLRAFLDAHGADYRPYYVANTILVHGGDLNLLRQLTAFSEVEAVLPNLEYQLIEPIDPRPAQAGPRAPEPGLNYINAPDVWAMGYTGSGLVLAGADTGMQWDHPALINHYRGWDGTTADHNYNWWDATGQYPTAPGDGHGHGTHISGTMVGDDGGSNQIGVAPGAQVVHCKNMTNSGSGNDGTFTTCFEWTLAPWDLTGANPQPALAPHVSSNSWGYWGGGAPQFQTVIDNLEAAGIVVVVAAGNEGPSCGSLRSPGDYQSVLSIGSVNYTTGNLTGSSSRGPSSLFPGAYVPTVLAPGEAIRSSLPGNSYAAWSGTSMATPHVAGMIALMWDASPALMGDVATTMQIIRDTAIPLTGQSGSNCGGDYVDGPNNDWGYGTVDALAAVIEAVVAGQVGTLTGNVSAAGGGALEDALVEMVRQSDSQLFTTQTDALGDYTRALPEDDYDVTVSRFGYLPQTQTDVEIVEDETTVLNFTLSAAPSWEVTGQVTDADTGWSLQATIDINGYPGSPIQTDPVTGNFSVTLPEGMAFEFTVTASGYLPTVRTVGPLSDDQTEDFGLDADLSECTAPGYGLDHAYYEDFVADNGDFTIDGSGAAPWQWGAPVTWPSGCIDGPTCWGTNLNGNYNNNANQWILSPVIDLSGIAPGTDLTAGWHQAWHIESATWDRAYAEISIDGGPWQEMWAHSGGTIQVGWTEMSYDLLAAAGTSAQFRFRLVTDSSVVFNGYYVDALRISECVPLVGATVSGHVYDANTSTPLDNALIEAATGESAMTDVDGFYSVFLPPGGNTLTASQSSYGSVDESIDIVDGVPVSQDFDLPAGWLQADPVSLEVTLVMGTTESVFLDLNNLGDHDADFQVTELPGSFDPLQLPAGYVPEPLERLSANESDYDALAMSAEGLFEPQQRQGPSGVLAAGDVLDNWPSGHSLPWGTGFSLEEWMVWVNDNSAGGGTGRNEEFEVDGTLTGKNFTPSFGGAWSGDMAFNTDTGMFWQVNVGGDNCIYEWDPAVPEATGNSICGAGWTNTSQRGLAYNPDAQTFFIGGWNDSVIYEIDASGATVSSCTMNLGVSGLAYNWEDGLLFAMLNAAPNTIEVIHWSTCSVVDSIIVAGGAFADFSGAGMGIDCDGNLWAANQSNQNIYLIDSGAPAGLCTGVPWLSEDPEAGTVPASGTSVIEVTFDASVPEVDQVGTYTATLRFSNDTPYGSLTVPVTMHVLDEVYGVEIDPAAASDSADPGEQAVYTLEITNTGTATDTFDLSLSGESWNSELSTTSVTLDASESANVTVTVDVPPGALGGDSDTVTVTAASTEDPLGQAEASSELTTTANAVYGVEVDPATASDSADPGQSVVYTLEITNTGTAADTFDLSLSGESWDSELSTTSLTLDLGESDFVTVTVDVPAGAAGGASDEVTVTVVSAGDPSGEAEAGSVLTSTANVIYGVDIIPTEAWATADPGQQVVYLLEVTNTGNATDTFDLSLSGQSWTSELSVTSLALDADQSESFTVTVTIPAGAADGAADMVTVTAESTEDPLGETDAAAVLNSGVSQLFRDRFEAGM